MRRLVTLFRELRAGVTVDGKAKLKSPSGTLSVAEAISVLNHGLALAAHFGDGRLQAADLAAGLVGAVVKEIRCRMLWCGANIWKPWSRSATAGGDLHRACRDLA